MSATVHCINPHCQRPYPQPWGNKFCNSCGAPLHLLDRYFSLKPLGAGGFAQIYTIWDEKTQTEKVLKVLVETSPKALELFKQEAEVLSSFRNSGVPTVDADGYFQINLVNPKPYQLPCLVMEKINGYTLEEVLINSPQGCSEDLVIGWFIQAVQILQELHQRQIIHRDIKPSNLMLRTSTPATPGKDDKLVLIDFGGAKQFSGSVLRSHPTSTRLYSSGYSPYEQIRGGNVGPAADFYALGRTIIQLLTGKYPPDLEDSLTGKLRWRN
jgi:serine/threonine protein kinase